MFVGRQYKARIRIQYNQEQPMQSQGAQPLHQATIVDDNCNLIWFAKSTLRTKTRIDTT